MFECGVSPEYVERAPLHRVIFWHGRAYNFYRRRAERLEEQQAVEDEIARAVKRLPARAR